MVFNLRVIQAHYSNDITSKCYVQSRDISKVFKGAFLEKETWQQRKLCGHFVLISRAFV